MRNNREAVPVLYINNPDFLAFQVERREGGRERQEEKEWIDSRLFYEAKQIVRT